jgi:hypothetical protein
MNTEALPIAYNNIEKEINLPVNDNYIFSYNESKKGPATITIYNPFSYTYTKIVEYEYKKDEILQKIINLEENIFLIYQIDSDDYLYEKIVKSHFNSNLDDIHKIFESKLDFCFTPVSDLLCFNISVVSDFYFDKVEKQIIQMLLFPNSIFIINKHGYELLQDIFLTKFNFKYLNNNNFYEEVNRVIADSQDDKKQASESFVNSLTLKEILSKKEPRKDTINDKNDKEDKHTHITQKFLKNVIQIKKKSSTEDEVENYTESILILTD